MPVAERWTSVDQLILNTLAAGDGSDMTDHELEAATGIERVTLLRALRDLKQAGYIEAVLVEVDQEDYPVRAAGIRLLPKGLQQTGVWPPDELAAAFLAALEKAIAQETDDEERTKLQAMLDAAKMVGVMALGATIGNAIGYFRGKLGL
jgi:DNA-binding Lrp family transcriptional regulator